MDQPIIGFVGVVLGAVITAGIAAGANYLLVVRKERAEAVKDRLSRANELKTAARLIVDDFSSHNWLQRSLLRRSVGCLEQLAISHWMRGRKIEKSSPANYRSKIGIR